MIFIGVCIYHSGDLYLSWMADLRVLAKSQVEKEVLDTIVDGLNGGQLTVDSAQAIAKETLSTLSAIDEHEQTVANFYKNLAQKYPIFNLLYTRVRDDIAKSKEMSAHRMALVAIHEGRVGEAQKIATSAMSKTANETADLK